MHTPPRKMEPDKGFERVVNGFGWGCALPLAVLIVLGFLAQVVETLKGPAFDLPYIAGETWDQHLARVQAEELRTGRTRLVTCPTCNGRGYTRNTWTYETSRCGSCGGMGQLMVGRD